MKFEKFITKRKNLILAVALLVSLPFGLLIPYSETDPDLRNYIPSDLTSRINTTLIENEFGNQNILFVILRNDSMLSTSSLAYLKEIDDALNSIPEIEKTISLFTTKNIISSEGYMLVEPCVPELPSDSAGLHLLMKKAGQNNMAVGSVISSDYKSAAIIAVLAESCREPALLSSIDSILLSYSEVADLYAGGLPYIRRSILKDVTRDGFILIPCGLILMLVLLWYLFSNWRGMVLPFSMVILSLIPTMGLVVFFGWKLSVISLLAPIMLIAIANNYGIHIVSRYNEYREGSPGESVPVLAARVIRSIKKPVLFTGITSIAGMMGMVMHSIVPAKHVGILTSIGIAWALILSLTLLPGLLIYAKGKKSYTGKKEKVTISDKFLVRVAGFISLKARIIIAAASALTLIGIAGTLLIRVDSNQENFFPKNHPVAVTSKIINRDFGGSQGISVMIEGDMMDPTILSAIDRWKKANLGNNGVGSVLSLSDAVILMSKGLYAAGEDGYGKIPDTRSAIAQMVELFNMSGDPEEFSSLTNFTYTRGQIIVRLSEASNKNIKAVRESLKEFTTQLGLTYTIGGYGYIMNEFAGNIVRGQVISLVYAILVIFILLSILTKSFAGGIISSLPIMGTIIIMFGFMGITGIPLDAATALLSSILIGVGVDYTIHYISRHTEFSKQGYSQEESVRMALSSTGRGIIFNGVSVMAGFSVLFFSGFTPIKYFGYLTIISIGMSLVAALIIIPSILIVFNPGFVKPKKKK